MSAFKITFPGTLETTTVKLSPNQCLFEVFENYCKSKNLDPSKYELCYSNKILDLRQSVNLSGLSNNSTLTVRPITKSRTQSVTVCVQLDTTGERQVGEFANDQSLWEIIVTLFPGMVSDCNSKISCLYMRKEVTGIDNLKEKKLSSLGILSGKVAIKLKIESNSSESQSTSRKSLESSKLSNFTKDLDIKDKVSSLQNNLTSKLEMLKQKVSAKMKKINSSEAESKTNVLEAESDKPNYEILDQLIELDINGRKVVFFSQDDKQRLANDQEISDEFFELTKEDARIIYNDLQSRKSNLEDRPLETQKLREQRLSKDEKKYEFTIIRLSFPFDHLVLQTTFKPIEKIKELVNLVKVLVNVSEFYLYTAPPKNVLDTESSFFKLKLVPSAMIQFGGQKKPVLKDEYKEKISSFKNVISYTSDLRTRIKGQHQSCTEVEQEQDTSAPATSMNQEAIDRVKKEERLMKLLNMKK